MATINDLVSTPFLERSNEDALSLVLSIRESRRVHKKPTFVKTKQKASKLDKLLVALANLSEADKASLIAAIAEGK